jgi:hypothetical protein
MKACFYFMCDIQLCVKVDLYRVKKWYGKHNITREDNNNSSQLKLVLTRRTNYIKKKRISDTVI